MVELVEMVILGELVALVEMAALRELVDLEEMEAKMGRKLSHDSGVDDDIDGGECQEIADLFTEQKIAVDVTSMELPARTQSSCSSLISGGDDSRTLELDIFTMCR